MKKGDIYLLSVNLGHLNSEYFIPKGTEYIYCSYSNSWAKDTTKVHILETIKTEPHTYGQECSDADFTKMFKPKKKT